MTFILKRIKSSIAYVLKKFKRFGIYIILIIIAWYVSNKGYQLVFISGDSMLPSYKNMQIVVLDKISKNYSYGDVILFYNKKNKRYIVKRIVACKFDEVYIKEGILYVNGIARNATYVAKEYHYAGLAAEGIVLQDSEFFVLGDNEQASIDSRYEEIGNVRIEQIVGKVVEW